MIKDIIVSLLGHLAVFAAILAPSILNGGQVEIHTVYTVRTVSPQAIERLLEAPEPQVERNERIPQVQVKEENEELPNPTYKPKQTVKQEQPREHPEEHTEPARQSEPDTAGAETEFAGIRLDSEFDYPEYLMDMQRRIQRNWLPPTLRESLVCRIFFRIGRDGRILRVYAEESSGNVTFDTSALKAVTMSGPFPPLPEEYESEDLGVHFDFIYEM